MKKITKMLGLVTILIIMSGCAALFKPSAAEMAKADYGDYPSNYETIVKNHCWKILKDPESAQYRFEGYPTRGYFSAFGPTQFGFLGYVWINAKNSFGGYAGAERYQYLIKNGVVLRFDVAFE